jgi:putative colanic acid biosynthesis glycosyltransferase
MKILIAQDDYPPHHVGGSAVIAENLAKQYVKEGCEVVVLTTTTKRNLEGVFKQDGVKVYRFYSAYNVRWRSWRCLHNPFILPKVKKLLMLENPDVLHVHNIHEHLSYDLLRVAKKYGLKIIFTAHDVQSFYYGKMTKFSPKDMGGMKRGFDYSIAKFDNIKKAKFRFNPLRNIYIRNILKKVDVITAVSHELARALEQNHISPVRVVHNGVDLEQWKKNEDAVRRFKEKFNLTNKKVILFGGRLSVLKGADSAIVMLEQVLKKDKNVVLLVMGKQVPYIEQMTNSVKQKDISKHVVFTDWITGDELVAAYYSSNVLVSPSLYLDPFPTVNLEAMACGLPIVTTCFGGSHEAVRDERNGYVIDPADKKAFVDAVEKVLYDNALAERMSKKGFARVKDIFSLKGQAQTYLKLFEEIQHN